jgi:hypothetical protein
MKPKQGVAMKKTKWAAYGFLMLAVTCSYTVLAQVQNPNPADQTAVTKDGRTVILKSDGTWINAPSPNAKGTLSIEAGVVFQSRDVKPLARTGFVLIDADLEVILKAANLTPIALLQTDWAELNRRLGIRTPVPPALTQKPPPSSLVVSLKLAMSFAGNERCPDCKPFLDRAVAGMTPHIVGRVNTDFAGKATFDPIPEGTYFVVGVADLPRYQTLIWNVQVQLKPGSSVLLLDANNATSR